MALDSKAIIQEIDELMALRDETRKQSKYDDMSDLDEQILVEVVVSMAHAINRFAPAGSSFRQNADDVFRDNKTGNSHWVVKKLAGILMALKRAYASGYLASVEELIHADVFGDFLEMADYLLSEGYKDPAAVLAGGVLEEHLRKLCMKNGIATDDSHGKPKKASTMNDELAKASAYDKLEQKQITAWQDLRNKAAHGQFADYDKNQVELLIQGIRGFLVRHRA